jgi:hypothetical protein
MRGLVAGLFVASGLKLLTYREPQGAFESASDPATELENPEDEEQED